MPTEVIKLDNLVQQNRSGKLHPYENEDENFPEASLEELQEKDADGEELGEFDRFRLSVGMEPDTALIVEEKSDDTYEIIDGDRRFHALKSNGAEDVECSVKEDLDEIERVATMIRANEQRKDNDPVQRAWQTAQFVAPWLLPSGERKFGDERSATLAEFGDVVGKSRTTISNWLKPIEREHRVRGVLGDGIAGRGRNPDTDDTEMVDDIINILDANTIVTGSQIPDLCTKMQDAIADGVNVSEIHSEMEKAEENGEGFDYLIDGIDAYMSDNDDSGVEAGMLGDPDTDSDPDTDVMNADDIMEDISGETDDEMDDFFADEIDPDSGDDESSDEVDVPFDTIDIDVNWDEYVNDDDLQEGQPLSILTKRTEQTIDISGDAAVGVHVLSGYYDMSIPDVVSKILEPAIAKSAVETLEAEVEAESEKAKV